MAQGIKTQGFDRWRNGIKSQYATCMANRRHQWVPLNAKSMRLLSFLQEPGYLITEKCQSCQQESTYERDAVGVYVSGSRRMKYEKDYLAPPKSGGLTIEDRGDLWLQHSLPGMSQR